MSENPSMTDLAELAAVNYLRDFVFNRFLDPPEHAVIRRALDHFFREPAAVQAAIRGMVERRPDALSLEEMLG